MGPNGGWQVGIAVSPIGILEYYYSLLLFLPLLLGPWLLGPSSRTEALYLELVFCIAIG